MPSDQVARGRVASIGAFGVASLALTAHAQEASDSVPGPVYVLAVGLQVLPLAVLISLAPALLAASFFFVRCRSRPSVAFKTAALTFIIAFGAIAVTYGTGAYLVGWRPGPRTETDMVRFLVMQYCVHSVIFWLVGAWAVSRTWRRSRVLAALLGTLIVAAELRLLLSGELGESALHPLIALSHAVAYVVLLFAVAWWTRQPGPAQQPT